MHTLFLTIFLFAIQTQADSVKPLALVIETLAKVHNLELSTEKTRGLYGNDCKIEAKLNKDGLPDVLVKVLDRKKFEIKAATFRPSYEKNSHIEVNEPWLVKVEAFRSCGDSLCEDVPEKISITESYISIDRLTCHFGGEEAINL